MPQAHLPKIRYSQPKGQPRIWAQAAQGRLPAPPTLPSLAMYLHMMRGTDIA